MNFKVFYFELFEVAVFRLSLISSLAALLLTTSCGQQSSLSQPEVTSVIQSSVKHQSIGNCWAYAMAGWAESLHLRATGEEVNLSESYWTYWHWYFQITNRFLEISAVDTAGSWNLFEYLLGLHGYVYEGEFIPHEATQPFSEIQANAMKIVNAALSPSGALAAMETRTPENARKLLDQAFGTEMAKIETIERRPENFTLGYRADRPLTFADTLGNGELAWQSLTYPKATIAATTEVQTQREEALKRIMRALNDHHPVVMQFFVDFNALDPEDGMFKHSTLQAADGPGEQGIHMVLLEDYATEELGEGELPQELKEQALEQKLRYFVAKNSWGTDRPDRGLTDGRTRFALDYLDLPLTTRPGAIRNTVDFFMLPPGY